MNVNYILHAINTTPIIQTHDTSSAQILSDISAALDSDLTAIKVAQERSTELIEKVVQNPTLGQATVNVSTVVGQPLEVVGI